MRIKEFLKRFLPTPAKTFNERMQAIETQLLIMNTDNNQEFYNSYKQMRRPKFINYDAISISTKKFSKELEKNGVEVRDYIIDKDEYESYLKNSSYDNYYNDYADVTYSEKTLEHFVASQLLELQRDDIYIDIASSCSPAPEIYSKLFGVKCFRQDLSFPKGINGNCIGGDAANMPVPNGFANKMALHCSFEHFEGDADVRFIKEVARVLKPNGMCCILPLYTSNYYCITTDPVVAINENVEFEEGVLLNCVEKWGNRYGRRYDVRRFLERVYKQIGEDIKLEVFNVNGAKEISSVNYLESALLLSKVG